jgi:Peptidase family M28
MSARIKVEARRETITSFNIVGELPGADDEAVIIGSHHDGPWSSAVEDGSGISLVLAQAAYWSRVPPSNRPHRLQFLLNCGHMSGGAGQSAFVRNHRLELDRVVLEVHLDHAAVEVAEVDGELRSAVSSAVTNRQPKPLGARRGATRSLEGTSPRNSRVSSPHPASVDRAEKEECRPAAVPVASEDRTSGIGRSSHRILIVL